MTALRVVVRRLLALFRRSGWETDLDDEMAFHLQMEIDRHLARGLPPAAARREAIKGFGGLDVTKEAYRDQKSLPFVETLLQDVRFGLRLLVKNRAFSVVAILTLALAIGANTALFSVVNSVLLEPLPFQGSDRIVTVWENFSAQGGPEQEWIEIPNFVEWKAETDLFETMVAYGGGATNMTGRGEAQRLGQAAVSYDFLATFAVAPMLGRDFTPADDQPGAPPVVMLSNGFWQREFAGHADAVGQTLQLNGIPTQIIGVTPAEFAIPGAPPFDLLAPLRLNFASASRGNFFVQGLARLREGVSVERAEARLNGMMQRIGEQYPENKGVTIALVPLLEQLVAPVRTALYVLLGVVMFVLLIACANIANLMLGRSATRARELAVRAAMGAGRTRLVRQLLTESVMLSLAGAALGVALAYWGTAALVAEIPPGVAPRFDNVAIDGTVLVFTLGISIAAGLIFGLAPVLQFSKHDVGSALKSGDRQSQHATGGRRLRAVLAAGQVALALSLLIASGLTIRSFVALMDVDPGFKPDGLTTASVSMPASAFAGPPELVTFLDGLIARVAARPGIDAVTAVSVLPLSGSDTDTSFEIEGRPDLNGPGRQQPTVWFRRVTPGYFQTMGVPVLKGREFTAEDRAGADGVVLVSDVTAAEFWPGQEVVGKRVRFGSGPWNTIVGVVKGVRHRGLGQSPRAELYFAFAQRPGRGMTLVVRSAADASAVAGMLRADLRELAPNLPLSNVASMSTLMASSVAQPKLFMALTAAFGFLALALAAVGIYGVMSYSVSQRTTEMGLRMALGAGRGQVLGLIVGHGVRLTAIGLTVGLLFAWWGTSFMSTMLFDIDPRDAVTFAAAPIALAIVAVVACLVPALRATRIDPIRALRVD